MFVSLQFLWLISEACDKNLGSSFLNGPGCLGQAVWLKIATQLAGMLSHQFSYILYHLEHTI